VPWKLFVPLLVMMLTAPPEARPVSAENVPESTRNSAMLSTLTVFKTDRALGSPKLGDSINDASVPSMVRFRPHWVRPLRLKEFRPPTLLDCTPGCSVTRVVKLRLAIGRSCTFCESITVPSSGDVVFTSVAVPLIVTLSITCPGLNEISRRRRSPAASVMPSRTSELNPGISTVTL